MAEARRQGADDQGQGAHPGGEPDDRRAGGDEGAHRRRRQRPGRHRLQRHRAQDQEAAGRRGARRKSFGGRRIVQELDLKLTPGMRLGLLGPNGSGKTTLLSLLDGTLEPDAGTIERADWLRTVRFEQSRDTLDKTVDPAPGPGAGRRLGRLPGPLDPRRRLGQALPLPHRAARHPGLAPLRRRAGAHPDRPPDAPARPTC